MRAIRGVLVAIAAFCVIFVAERLLQWMGLFILLLVACSWWYSYTIRTHILVTRKRSKIYSFRYSETTMELVVENTSFLPIPYLSVVDTVGNLYSGYQNRALLHMPRRSVARMQYDIRTLNRGEFKIGPVRVRGADPFGFFPWVVVLDLPATVIVYPQIHPTTFSPTTGVPSGSRVLSDPAYEDLTRYRSLREYRPGDELRRINWRATARTGVLHTNEYLSTLNHPIIVLLNLWEDGMQQRHRYHLSERSIELAASLVQAAVRAGQEVGFVSNGTMPGKTPCPSVLCRKGAEHAVAILECLARIDYGKDARLFELLQTMPINSGMRCLYIGSIPQADQIAPILSGAYRSLKIDFYVLDDAFAASPIVARLQAVPAYSIKAVPEYGVLHA